MKDCSHLRNYTLVSIEACLNSKPLYPLSNDPSDFLVLIPGHFLVGEPLTVFEYDLADMATNRLNKYLHIKYLHK